MNMKKYIAIICLATCSTSFYSNASYDAQKIAKIAAGTITAAVALQYVVCLHLTHYDNAQAFELNSELYKAYFNLTKDTVAQVPSKLKELCFKSSKE